MVSAKQAFRSNDVGFCALPIALGVLAQGVNVEMPVIPAICVAAGSHRRGFEVSVDTGQRSRPRPPRRNQTKEHLS
jgi:hypothetical protein